MATSAGAGRRILIIAPPEKKKRKLAFKYRVFWTRWTKSSGVVRATECQCKSRNSPGFDVKNEGAEHIPEKDVSWNPERPYLDHWRLHTE
jgi:hypothetical protein